MRAIVITRPGGPEELTWADVPDPCPGPGDVLLDVIASGVNWADVLQRRGNYPPPPGAPPYPGLECSGMVAAVGDGVTSWSLGDEVCALLPGGGYAEKVTVTQGHVRPIPLGTSPLHAAALPETACTVWENVFEVGRLKPDETLLVHGGASGIGTLAIQLASALGSTVICTAGSPDKLARCRQLGANLAISYRAGDFSDAVLEFTAGQGADVILDIVGASYLSSNIKSLATRGRLVVIGTQGGQVGQLDFRALGAKQACIYASTLRGRPAPEKAAIVAAVRKHVWPLVECGQVRPVVDRILPLADAGTAHQVLEARQHIGKILLAAERSGDT